MSGGAREKRPAPLSIRLNLDERSRLERDAAGLSLSAYIKDRIFDADAPPRRTRGKAPVKDHRILGQLLAKLGASRLASNINQMAKAAHLGTLPVGTDTEAALQRACVDIAVMRCLLMQGLGMRVPESEIPHPTVLLAFTAAVAPNRERQG
tara:strand:+ start:149 stop:601 length:453 start_codon:yes stop_codon:yes gene_type:complete